MAPSSTTWIASQDSEDDTVRSTTDGQETHTNDSANGDKSPRTKLYTDAYTHGYTEGYCAGNIVPRQMPIAIVGMSCRLPGDITTPDEFWELCSRARSGWTEIPKDRFESASFYHPNQGKTGCFNAKGGNFLKEDLGLFDAPFFSLTAQEATSMDPQQRILLECTFEALDSAGIPKHEIVGKDVGVFVGGSFSEYEAQSFADTETIPMYQATGCAFAMQSNRISHFFDLRGPSFTMDTACSSSLVALHQACQSIRNGESKSAIVGGCHLNMLPEFWVSMAKSRLFSDEGRSFSFDNRGTGYGRGEGCGIVVLKPLDQALKDNDIVRSVIVASGVNQDGRTPGITMPNGSAQESLMRSVYKNAGIDPKDTGYVEAHGTGTKVGDPIEISALHNVFGENRSARNPLFVGSVKSNIGHLEAASGIVSIIKAAMMLERGFILPNYDFKTPNENIPFSKWHLKVPVSQRPWPRPKRFASVNNFGFGGTNAHVILERAPFLKENDSPSDSAAQLRKLFVLSANDKSALEALMKNIGIYLEQRPEIFQNNLMSNIAYTLGQRRSLMQWRVAIPTTSSFDLIQALNSGKVLPVRENDPRIGFVFTGQGAQYYNMGRELYENYPVYASTIESCDRYLASLGAPFSLAGTFAHYLHVLASITDLARLDELNKDETTSRINEAHISQPACTAIQLALTDLLRSWGIAPTAVVGHSSGEIGAAYAAGILPLDSCMAISFYRGMVTLSLKKKFPGLRGSMMAVGGTKEEIEPLIQTLVAKEARIACFNSPTSLTISGDEPAIDELQAIMEKGQIFNRKLQVDVAYHSHHMELVAKDYLGCLRSLHTPKSTQIKFYSSLSGRLGDASKLEPSYWVDNLTQPVRFSEAVTSMCEAQPLEGHKTGVNMIIEIGPHSALAGPVKQILKGFGGSDTSKIPYASALVRKKDAVETALDLASTLVVKGATLDMGAINFPKAGKSPELLIDMPRYPWNHKTRYWHENRVTEKHRNRKAPRHDLLGTLANYSNDLEPTWRNILRVDDVPWLRHHKIQSLILFPMSGFISMAVEAVSQYSSNIDYDSFELRDVLVHTPLIIGDEDIETTIQLRPQEGTRISEFRIHSWAADKGWTEHCKGLIGVKSKENEASVHLKANQILSTASTPINKAALYSSLFELGISYGPSLQGINDCKASDSCATASIMTVDTLEDLPPAYQAKSVIQPTLLEQLIDMYWPILGAGAGRTSFGTVYLPSSIERMIISRGIAEVTATSGDSLTAFCTGLTPNLNLHPKPIQMSMFATARLKSQEPLIMIDGLTISPILKRGISTDASAPHRELCYKLDWEPIPEPLNSTESTEVANGLVNGSCNGRHGHVNGTTNGTSNGEMNGASNYATEIVIIHTSLESQILLASKLAGEVEHLTGTRPEAGTLMEVNTDSKLCLVISELDTPLLPTLTLTEFNVLQKILTSVQGILWVVRGAYASSSNPHANMVSGLSRSIRSETLLKFATIDLDSKNILNDSDVAETILTVFKATFGPKAESNCELEFMERNKSLFTPRIINDVEMNEYVHKKTKASILEPTPFSQAGRALEMVIGTPGSLATLHFVDQPTESILAADEIKIEVKAIGMNSCDILTSMGQLESPAFGVECSGVVTELGKDVVAFAVEDRVAGIFISGVYSTYARTKATFAFKVGNGVSFETAASIPVAYSTAHYGLINLGRLLEDERVLIHGAGSATGQAAICLARILGADILAVVNNNESKELLKKTYGLRDDQISPNLPGHAAGEGSFDLVFNCVDADLDTMRELWSSLNSFGRLVEIGSDNINARARFDAPRFGNKSFMWAHLMSLALQRPNIIRSLLSDVSKFLDRGVIEPISAVVFPISDVETAFQALKSGHYDGKLIVSPRPGDLVKATPSKKTNTLLRPDTTYILIGGTGGLGRSMARWMVLQGARNLVLVSRNGSVAGEVKDLVDTLAAAHGARIIVRRCDVSNEDAVRNLVSNELTDMPQIKGVIHGAMILKDVLFEKMAHDQYTTVIESKVRGAWNFHHALESSGVPLDFFVAISSAAGAVGNRGQAAYSAANTFLNAFVQYRQALGLPASSLDLTAVSDAGYLAENTQAAAEVSKNLGSDTICEAEVLALLEAAIDGHLARTCNSHTITGMRITSSGSPPFWTNDAKFKHLRLAAEAVAAENSSGEAVIVSFNEAVKSAKSLEDAEQVVQKGLLNKLSSVLMLEEDDMDVTHSLSNYALDSLVAIEVRNFITREFEANLQPTATDSGADIFDSAMATIHASISLRDLVFVSLPFSPGTKGFLEQIGTEIVDIFVGPEERLFRVHKTLLCERIPYFEKMFQGGFKETVEGTARMPEDDSDAFDALLDMVVYHDKIRPLASVNNNDGSQSLNWDPIGFYGLAEKLCLFGIADHIMDAVLIYHSRTQQVPSVDFVHRAYSKTTENSKLRKYAARAIFYALQKFEGSISGWKTSEVQKLFEDHPDFSRDFIDIVRDEIPRDPREMKSCYFHVHGFQDVCPISVKANKADS
ncbi:Reducing polyketide synthase [Lachnellula suecica]|uniref:Reducing polyketide synthase n=1 Tax=Lachnellula suecica TaxID=602035 RepID=A0A8T9CAK7_9HELO|nr:Reducing polyketide synthase [Lachnellula suecica]